MEDRDYKGWGRYEALVLSELKGLKESHAELIKAVADIKLDVNTLKVKSAMWGSVAGAGVAAIVSLILGLLMKVAKI